MGRSTLSFEDVRQRNEEIVAYANQHPEVSNTALGVKYGLSRETVRQILERDRQRGRAKPAFGSESSTLGFQGH